MKNTIRTSLLLIAASGLSTMNARASHTGDAMLGSFIGGTAGGLLGGAITAPRSSSGGGSSRDGSGREALRAVDSLERATKSDLTILNDRLTKMEQKTRYNYEDDIEELRTGHQSHKKQVKTIESKVNDVDTKLDDALAKIADQEDKISKLEKRIAQLEGAAKK